MNPEFQPQMSQMNTDGPAAEKHLRPSVPSAAKEEHSPKISVIVPVYKVEKYLPECIESVLAQTFTDFELILVDDGSPDNSGAICDAYAARDPRIRVFHKENGGVTSARRLGVERSRGEWITFVDSDDKLFPNALRDLMSVSEKYPDADLIEGKITRKETMLASEQCKVCKVASKHEYACAVASYKYFWFPYPFAKIIRKNVLLSTNALDIPSWINFAEDLLMNLRASTRIRSAIKISSIIYFYRKNENGACQTIRRTARYYCDFLKEIEKIHPHGLNREWRSVWIGVARYRFVEMFFKCPDWNSNSEYAQKIKRELALEKSISLGTKICLWIENFPILCARSILKNLAKLILNFKNGIIRFLP